MASSKIQVLSTQLCEALGVDSSAENINKVTNLLTELVKEITQENTDS